MKKLSLLLVIIMLVSVFAAGCGGGTDTGTEPPADQMVLRMATDHPIDHIATRANEKLIADVLAATDGRIKIDLYPASQLGDYNTVYPEIVKGTIDIAHITIPDSLDSRLGSAYTPYLTTGYDQAKVIYAPGGYLYNKFDEYNSALGVKFLGFFIEGYIGMGTVKEPTDMLTPGTDKGLKIRVWAAPASRAPMTDLGYTAITVPYAEAPTAIQTGVVDGWIGGTPNVNYHWVGEVIKNFYVTYMHAESSSYVINKALFDGMTPEDQKIISDAFAAASNSSFVDAAAEDAKWIEELKTLGVTVTILTPEQIQSLADFVREKSWPQLEEVYTKELLDGIKAEVEKAEAAQ
jgi:TRAP-type C4-dicarboxylate transport system substrate-binding protein